ncbi:MAG: hypothetical protein ACYS9H_03225 [Planctomycetota bacterium]|jgi:hypothetical protein
MAKKKAKKKVAKKASSKEVLVVASKVKAYVKSKIYWMMQLSEPRLTREAPLSLRICKESFRVLYF